MTEWGVVGVLIAVIGLFVTVGKPLLALNKSIVQLEEGMKSVNRGLDGLNEKNTQDHRRIWDKVDKQGATLEDHEKRIQHLEFENENDHKNGKE